LHVFRSYFRSGQCWQQQRRQNGNDSYYYQQFYQREAGAFRYMTVAQSACAFALYLCFHHICFLPFLIFLLNFLNSRPMAICFIPDEQRGPT
jgi:hypothetical protein